MPPVSKFSRLPQPMKDMACELFERGVSVEEITDALRARGADVSRPGVGRARRQWQKSVEKLQETRALAETVVRGLASQPEDKLARLNVELIQGSLADAMTALRAKELAPEKSIPLLLKASMAVNNAARAARDDAETIIKTSGFAEAKEGELMTRKGDRLVRVELVEPERPAIAPDGTEA